jgi:hypothetical protein
VGIRSTAGLCKILFLFPRGRRCRTPVTSPVLFFFSPHSCLHAKLVVVVSERSATWEDRHNLKLPAVGLCMCVQNLASFGMIGNRTSCFSVFLRHVYVAKVWDLATQLSGGL